MNFKQLLICEFAKSYWCFRHASGIPSGHPALLRLSLVVSLPVHCFSLLGAWYVDRPEFPFLKILGLQPSRRGGRHLLVQSVRLARENNLPKLDLARSFSLAILPG